MNIGQLKRLIEDLPNDTPVLECFDGPMAYGSCEPKISVKTVYEFETNRERYWFGKLMVEPEVKTYTSYIEGRETLLSEYTALVIDTAY